MSQKVFQAIHENNRDRVAQIIAADASQAHARNEAGVSAVMQARYESRMDIVELLRNAAGGLDGRRVELLLLDGHKALYLDILNLVEKRLKPGALVVADNADFNPEYVARMRSPANGYLSTPFGSDVELSLRIG